MRSSAQVPPPGFEPGHTGLTPYDLKGPDALPGPRHPIGSKVLDICLELRQLNVFIMRSSAQDPVQGIVPASPTPHVHIQFQWLVF